ncbi:HNH endonuclease [Citricoccus sp. SGAir0253]|uniref:HNH endonuclease family protein n=1 Tax=Citricoccus sp. SGAir0253 TaxID=2567881 RepID=UPI0010CD1EB5|nr:HNH endonuclease family protein [Citricoccus sp. SGAir0253]QCU76947.1 HNH endonuclease [Citricoccus sp. SGAir0253]
MATALPSPALPSAGRRRGLPLGRRTLRAAVAGVLAAGFVLLGVTPAEAATTYSAPLRTAVKSLPVAAESNSGYDRDRQFGDWIDADRDCQNTRAEVLLQETRARATYTTSRKCTVRGGRWVTSWDGRTHTSASTVQIDHLVPVHEAWGSGARKWTKARRVAFYNDLGDRRTLSAQTSALNSSKGARGPEQWLPPRNRCAYVGEWVAVKKRWGLTVDSTEKAALTRLAAGCPNVTLTVVRR